jgi:hypothetical protein
MTEMKLSIIGTLGKGNTLPRGFAFDGPSDRQMSEPVSLRYLDPLSPSQTDSEADLFRGYRLWLFRNKFVRVEQLCGETRDEIVVHVKDRVLIEERAFARMVREVELLEKMQDTQERGALAPEEVRRIEYQLGSLEDTVDRLHEQVQGPDLGTLEDQTREIHEQLVGLTEVLVDIRGLLEDIRTDASDR